MAQRNVIRIIAAAVLFALCAGGLLMIQWLRRTQPLPVNELLKIGVQLDAAKGVVKAHITNGSDYRLRDVSVRVVALRPKPAASQSPDNGGWEIETSWCTFDPVSKPVEYDKVVDRQIQFSTNLKALATGDTQAKSNFVPGTDYWECRIVGAHGFK